VRKHGEVVELGDWEYFEADSGLFVMPGVYTDGKVVYDETGARTIKPVTKIRGGDAKKYGATLKANQWLIENVRLPGGRLLTLTSPSSSLASSLPTKST
jgi:hypothetical protein